MQFDRDTLDREFPSRKEAVQFNHAASAPLPARSRDALIAFAERLARRGSLDYGEWLAECGRLRKLGARLIGADDRVGAERSVAIVPNTTAGLNLVAQGFPWQPGDEVVTTATEFPANLTPWLSLRRHGVIVHRIPTRDGAFALEDVDRVCTEKTRLLCVSAVSFHTGFVAPLDALGEYCKGRGIAFGLDAIQAVGALPIDVVRSRVDFLSADGHKWMLGPDGCGLFFTAPGFRSRLCAPAGWMNLKRQTGTYRVEEEPEVVEDARKFEGATTPTASVYTLVASLELLLSIGIEIVNARIGEVLNALRDGLQTLGCDPIVFDEGQAAFGSRRSGILSARPPRGRDARALAHALEARGILISAREGLLRFSPHVGNDVEEAGRILAELARLLPIP